MDSGDFLLMKTPRDLIENIEGCLTSIKNFSMALEALADAEASEDRRIIHVSISAIKGELQDIARYLEKLPHEILTWEPPKQSISPEQPRPQPQTKIRINSRKRIVFEIDDEISTTDIDTPNFVKDTSPTFHPTIFLTVGENPLWEGDDINSQQIREVFVSQVELLRKRLLSELLTRSLPGE
jgi:hypothetical protein